MKSMAGHSTLTDPQSVPRALSDHHVQRIVGSNTFKSAPTLQQLFQFLATRALDAHPDEIKEYTIGVEALGRKQDFDPKIDPIVRVQIYRLRQKLKEYYEMEGSRDSILVEVPKGHYLPTFKLAKAGTPALHEVPAPESRTKPDEPGTAPGEVPRSGFIAPRARHRDHIDRSGLCRWFSCQQLLASEAGKFVGLFRAPGRGSG